MENSWKPRLFNQTMLGFSAALYSTANDTPVLAFAGTDDHWDAAIDNLMIKLGKMPPQASLAFGLARVQPPNVIFTGHSLGGALAIIAAAQTGHAAVSFNAPGVMGSCILGAFEPRHSGMLSTGAAVGRCLAGGRIKNIRTDGDIVSSYITGPQSGGREQTLSADQCGFDALCRHAVATCVEAVRRDDDNFLPISL